MKKHKRRKNSKSHLTPILGFIAEHSISAVYTHLRKVTKQCQLYHVIGNQPSFCPSSILETLPNHFPSFTYWRLNNAIIKMSISQRRKDWSAQTKENIFFFIQLQNLYTLNLKVNHVLLPSYEKTENVSSLLHRKIFLETWPIARFSILYLHVSQFSQIFYMFNVQSSQSLFSHHLVSSYVSARKMLVEFIYFIQSIFWHRSVSKFISKG